MAEHAQQFRALADAAGASQRALESAVVRVDSAWADSARRGFEADHLGSIRSDARHLRVELTEIAAEAEGAMRSLQKSEGPV